MINSFSRDGRILIVDNHARRLEATTLLLKHKGYQVFAAHTLQEAEQLLSKKRIHLALLDIRMEADLDPSDTSGINFAMEIDPVVALIITTAYPTPIAIEAFLALVGNRDPLPDFVNAKDGPLRLIEAINQAFLRKVQVNFDLTIHWQNDLEVEQVIQNIALSGYPPAVVANEIEQVLCKLFSSADEIVVSPLVASDGINISSQSDSAVLKVTPHYRQGGWGAPLVLKLAARDIILTEVYNYKRFVQNFIQGNRRTNLERSTETHALGGIVYSLVGASVDEVIDFGTFYKTHKADRIILLLNTIFEESCRYWYNNRKIHHKLDLTNSYSQFLKISKAKIETALHAADMTGFISASSVQFPTLKLDLPNPLLFLEKAYNLRISVYTCVTHGDLHSGNILLDDREQAWLVDFYRTGEGHILRDIIELETDIKFNLLEYADLPQLFEFESALLNPIYQEGSASIPDSFSHPELKKAFVVISALRKMVERNLWAKAEITEYYCGLLLLTLNILRLEKISRPKKRHALLAAGLLVRSLEFETSL